MKAVNGYHFEEVSRGVKELFFLLGPTAVGKTEVACGVAESLGGEVISCDSMQVYRFMDVGTAKPSKKVRLRVPHHLLDVVSPDEEFTVSDFRRRALKAIGEIHKRDKIPIVAGGSGLYYKSLIDGLFPAPGRDKKLRQELSEEAEEKGSSFLHKRLKRVDPQAASKIHPNDLRRIIRALEVYTLTGKPISELKKKTAGIAAQYNIKIIGLTMPRPLLYERIDKRVERMFTKGLVAEVKRLAKAHLIGPTAAQSLGYKEVLAYLNGQCNKEETVSILKKNTRHFARRQLTWFRNDKRVKWIEIEPGEAVQSIVDKVLAYWKN